jgi:hypothetical protein
LVAQAAVTPPPQPPASLAVGQIGEQAFTGGFTCPADEICMRYPALTSFAKARTLAGPVLPKRFPARIWLHTRITKGAVLVVIVQPRADGRFEVRSWTAPQHGSACLPSAIVDATRLQLPGEITSNGDNRCFRL